jgi:hypothetical protein
MQMIHFLAAEFRVQRLIDGVLKNSGIRRRALDLLHQTP